MAKEQPVQLLVCLIVLLRMHAQQTHTAWQMGIVVDDLMVCGAT